MSRLHDAAARCWPLVGVAGAHRLRLRRLQAAAARRHRRRRQPDHGPRRCSATCSTWCPSRRSRSTTSASARSPTSRSTGYTADVTLAAAQRHQAARQRGRRRSGRPACSARSSSRSRRRRAARAPSRCADGDVIPLERTGRNPEVEEVLGALSLLLNGGGVAQLQDDRPRAQHGARRAARARPGRCSTRSSTLMTQLDDNKADIVHAIDSLNDLVGLGAQAGGQHRRRARGAARAR